MAWAKGIAAAIACSAILASAAATETRVCAGANIAVTTQNQEQTALVCDAVTRATALFAECAVPAPPAQTQIKIVDAMPMGCFGLFHCDTGLVEVLSPDVLAGVRPPDSIFATVATDAYFQSIVIHELAHAATEGMPCPFDGCFVAPEYVAYLMQMKSLDPTARQEIARAIDMDLQVSFEGFHPFILLLAPDIFAQRVWAHHHQQDDPCGFVAALVKGETYLDFEIFELE